MTLKREAEELLLIDEADAWFEYLEATRAQSQTRYRERAPWAWAPRTHRLRPLQPPLPQPQPRRPPGD